MDVKARGIGRYLNEYIFYRSLKAYPAWKGHDQLRASQGRLARERLDASLAAKGLSMDQLGPNGTAELLGSIDEALGSVWPDYTPMFADAAAAGDAQRHYVKMKSDFAGYIGAKGQVPGGVRLPVSPFDPRWSGRETVMAAGTDMLSIPEDLVSSEVIDETGYNRLSRVAPDESFKLSTLDVPEGWSGPRELGPANSAADAMGLSALRPYMSEREYRETSDWVLAGATEVDKRTGVRKGPMTPEALARSVAVLEYLNENGIDYRVARDRLPGQLVARPVDSKAEIRITGAGPDGVWVGRTYDNGIVTRFSDKGGENHWYEPTPQEAVSLVRFALGEAVDRFDGRGTIGAPGPRDLSANRQRQHSYHVAGKDKSMLEARPGLWILRDATVVSQASTRFADEASAVEFLTEAVDSAREGVEAAIDADGLLAEYMAHRGELDYVPDFTGVDEEILVLKQEYWRLLTDPGSGVELLDPFVEHDDADPEAPRALVTGDSPAEKVANHAGLVARSMVGTYAPDASGRRFDPVVVAKYMSSGHNLWRNNDDIVAACAKAGIDAGSLRGDDYYNRVVADNLIEFDERSAVDMSEHPSPMVNRLGERARAAIERGAADVTSLRIDDNGVVSWTARRRVGVYDDTSPDPSRDGLPKGQIKREVTGQFGQIFARGPHGEITTAFAGSENFTFMPGFEAFVVAQRPGEDLSLEQRTRLRGYEESMARAIEQTLARDIANPRSEVGRPTSLNSTVRRLAPSSERHPVDFFARLEDPGVSQADKDFLLAQADMGARRVRYPTAMGQESNALAYRRALTDERFDELNDNDRSWLLRTGMRNINELDRDAARGIFDPMATGTDENQGLVRYLTPGAMLNPDGSIVPSATPDARVGVLAHEYMASTGYNPADRQIKAVADATRADAIDPGVRTALTQLGGWNYEDGIVVSEEFAARNTVTGADGRQRPLMIGDKLSDMGNNKGVISLVVDRYMQPEQAEALGVRGPVQLFADNPDLDVVMSPFSPISRFNGGTAREMMADPGDLVVRDEAGNPETMAGATGPLNFMITHLTVDSKTNVYDAEAVAAGKGRKASSQLAWALQSQGAYEVMRDLYGDNAMGSADVREYLLALGMDLDSDGTVLPGPSAASLQGRRLFGLAEPVRYARRANDDPSVLPKINHTAMNEAFGRAIGRAGGLMEIPFPLTLADGSTTPLTPSGQDGVYALPLLSSHLRAEQDLAGGMVSRHDHTQRYLSIFENANRYIEARRLRDEAALSADAEAVLVHTAEMDRAAGAAQRSYEAIAKDVISRRVESKTNMFKESLMGARQAHSATAVWSPNPQLEVDQIAMNRDMAIELDVRMMNEELAQELGVAWTGVDPDPEDGYVLCWRDPVLRDGGVRYLRVVIDDSLTGVAVNPVMVKSMDGDFDGDSIGLVGGLGYLAHLEATETLTVEANLLDRGQRVAVPLYTEGENGTPVPTGQSREVYPLSLHTGLDIEVACKRDPELRPFIDTLTVEANDVFEAHRRGEIDRAEFCDRSRAVMAGLSGSVYRDSFEASGPRDGVALRFDGLDKHLRSVQDCYLLGGKGSEAKLGEYASYLGADFDLDGAGLVTAARDVGMPDPVAFDERYRGSQAAMAFKAQITGIAGSISQGAIRLGRAQGLIREACELSYPATQSVLQAKHDPVDAAYRADIITGPAKDLWCGYRMTAHRDDNGRYQWAVDRDHEGRPRQASTEEWVEQFMTMYADKAGMGVPIAREHVEAMAAGLTDERTGRMYATKRDEWDRLPQDKVPLALDRLAYGGKFEDLKQAAVNHERLFRGATAGFAPKIVLDNERVRAELATVGADYLGSGRASEPTARAERQDTLSDYSRRLPRSVWTARTPGWTRAQAQRPDPFLPAPESVLATEVVVSQNPQRTTDLSIGARLAQASGADQEQVRESVEPGVGV